jgi:phosphotransferase system enzyme I (PtsI)
VKLKGIGASSGYAIYPAFVLKEVNLDVNCQNIDDIDSEIKKLDHAIELSIRDIEQIKEKTMDNDGESHALIFDAHIQMAKDPEIKRKVHDLITNEALNAECAYKKVTQEFIDLFHLMDDDYFKERASDIMDVSQRVLAHMLHITLPDLSLIDKEVIIVANDLTPSMTSQLNKNYVKGFCTDKGGRTSHSAIMARTLEIPAVVGLGNITSLVEQDQLLSIDGIEGLVYVSPTKKEVKIQKEKETNYLKFKQLEQKYKNLPSVTKDGHKVELAANIGNPKDMKTVLINGAEGIGLYRTEFLYMGKDQIPTEDEQYIAYADVLKQMPNSKVVIRTLDIGGDKHLSYLQMDEELNPFLGHRALRLCLEKTDLFKQQLRALLRASIHGNLHIMFPMVATIEELRQAKQILEECKLELTNENKDFSEDIKVGIMVEIPSVAMLADQFAKEVDFFSIGTNDLIQYSFAADRMNEKVSYLYQPLNPSLLRLISQVIKASHEAGIWTGMCGEMAGDELAALVLCGLGLDEFSMSATSILSIRYKLSQYNYETLQKLSKECLKCSTQKEVIELINSTLKGE